VTQLSEERRRDSVITFFFAALAGIITLVGAWLSLWWFGRVT